jgi:hypothetical protein
MTNPNYLGVYSLPEGRDIILTIKSVGQELVMGADGGKEQCVVMHFQEPVKPFICNKTNLKQITKLLKTPYVEHWTGHKIQIGSEKVKAFGEIWDALRIRPYLPVEKELICADCGKKIEGFGGKSAEVIAKYTLKNYGRCLCSDCATKASEANKKTDEGVL